MAIYIVSYDLRAPGRNYDALYKALRSLDAFAHPLESLWLIEVPGSASHVRDTLKTVMDKNDGIVVIEFTPAADWAVSGINSPSAEWIQAKRP